MLQMRVLILGAGQDVGRSCVVVRIGGKTLMLDCGMHMGYSDARRFPDFSLLGPPDPDYTSVIDAVLISHFHMDHVGALPYFTEVCGYDGPVFMTHPTRAIAPIMLQDFSKVLRTRVGSGPIFAEHHITASMAKVRLMDLQETVQVCEGVEVTPYYAGHVLGAAMLHVRAGSESLVYTGDFNTVPERHLSGASIPRLCPDLLISESTYATSIREDRRSRERQLLHMIHQTVTAGGKVLVPVFAVGRAQELLLLLGEHWQRTELEVPIYVSSIMASRANTYFKLLQNWASERVKQAAPGCRAAAFDFSRVQDWSPDLVDKPEPCVLFATPGMLHGGTSLEVFKAWAPEPKNLVLLPSYQVAGTVGRKLMLGVRQGLQLDARTTLDVRCKVDYAALSAHTDAKGILQVVQQVAPSAVMLVHGEADKMSFMSDKITRSLNIPCFMPANGEEVAVESGRVHNIPVSAQLLRQLPAAAQRQQLGRGQVLEAEQGVDEAAAAAAAGVPGRQEHMGRAAAGWLQHGDVGQLAAAATRLAGLAPGGTAATAAGVAAVVAEQQQQQQQLVQMHGSVAAARAAQLAPWLEFLAAAAQEATQQQQQQPGQIAGGHAIAAEVLQASLVSVAADLQQQLQLEQQAVVVDGVLLVHHPQGVTDSNQQQGGSADPVQQQQHHQHQAVQMELLPTASAAAVLQVQQHRIRLSCRLQLPPECMSTQQQDRHATAASFIAGALQRGLPPPVAQRVIVSGLTVELRSLRFQLAAEACGDGGAGCWKCSWDLADDALAQQCVGLVQQSL